MFINGDNVYTPTEMDCEHLMRELYTTKIQPSCSSTKYPECGAKQDTWALQFQHQLHNSIENIPESVIL